MALEYVLAPGTSNETILDAGQIQGHNPVLTHTGLADLRATIRLTGGLSFADIQGHAQRQDRLNINWNGSTKWTGFVTGASADRSRGGARIQGKGVGKRLQETRPDYSTIGGPVKYQNIALEEALRDYWPRTPFGGWNVTDAQTEQVASNQQLQSADTTSDWSGISSIADDVPIEAQNNNLELLQTCFVSEGENPDRETDPSYITSQSNMSNGAARGVYSSTSNLEYDFVVPYRMPASAVGLKARVPDMSNAQEMEVQLDVGGVTYTLDYLSGGEGVAGPDWEEYGQSAAYNGSGYTGDDIPEGSTVTARLTSTGSNGGDYYWDVIALYDARYTYFFDNDNGGSSGYLDGPELYPDGESVELATEKTGFNITSASVSSVWNDTSGGQSISLSNDNGATYTSTSNSSTATVDFGSAGRQAKVRLTFDRWGSRTTATPKMGFKGQKATGDNSGSADYTLSVDGNDRPVIVNLELSRNHFDNLQTLHNYGDFLWVIEHDSSSISNLVVESFKRGEVTRPSPPEFDREKNQQPAIQSGAYYNSIYLQGRQDSNGDRPSAEVKDSTAISNDNREISPGVLRDLDVSTSAGAEFRARSLLETAQSNNDLVGSVTVPPVMTTPGYARAVDFGNGEQTKTVEEVSLSQDTDTVEAVFDFVTRSGFSEDIKALRSNSREQGDQL